MDYMNSFLTIAEIAAAFAGFASIVSALGARDSSELDLKFRWLLRGMIVCSLVVVAASLFPMAPQALGLSAERAWLYSSLFFTVLAGALLVGGTIDSLMVKSVLPLWVRALTLLPILLAFFFSLAGLMGFSLDLVRAFYLIALLLLLSVSVVLFGSIVLNRVAPRQ